MAATNSVIVAGDSISDRISGQGWADVIRRDYIYVEDNSVGSTQLVADIEPKFTSYEWDGRRSNCNIAILQGGINDIKTAFDTPENMWTAMQAMIAYANADGANVFVMNLTPWKSYVGWSAANQIKTDTYNAYLAANEAEKGYTLIDLYSLLEDPSTPDTLLPAYDDGDGLHPSSPEARDAIASQVYSQISPFIEDVDMDNPLKFWRGAVDPADRGGSGNQLKFWRGACQPAHIGGWLRQNQTTGANAVIRSNNYGWVLLDRNLTAGEEANLYTYLDEKAGI